jgi:hypothetical protein
MSWVNENKFLAGFAGATLVCAGALAFLVFQAKGQYQQAQATYEEQSNELNRLQTLQPFPNAENVKKLDEQRKAHAQAIVQLQQSLAKMELPLENVSPQQFQDRLRATVDTINQNANQNGVKRAEAFNLGFDRYLSEPPRPEAAGPLARQLKAIEILVSQLIRDRVVELTELKREELPEEKVAAAAAETPPAKGAKPAGKGDPRAGLVASSTVEVSFLAEQPSFAQSLNSLISAKEQFFVPRLIKVVNEKPEGPSRAVAVNEFQPPTFDAGAGAPAIPETPAPGAQPGGLPPSANPGQPGVPPSTPPPAAPQPRAKTIIVGEERVQVTMRVEILDFAEPQTPASK